MANDGTLNLNLRSQILKQNANGYNVWEVVTTPASLRPAETALLLCDVWERHWSRGATERLNAMVPRMNQVVTAARAKGVSIIHAPSGTMDYYAGTPARKRMIDAPPVEPPADQERPDPPLPVDASDQGSDTGETKPHSDWEKQHPGIEIDQARDGISDNGREVYNFMRQRGISNLIIMGVHTNMCILRRTFAIKQMVKWGVNVALIRDLTDAMYNPASAPYVSHADGTRLVVEYIEKFWCPTIGSEELAPRAA
jgi:nicotinamidase-related amidase